MIIDFPIYDFCVYSLNITSARVDVPSISTIVANFTAIKLSSFAKNPTALINYLTDIEFFDPLYSGNFTVKVDYSWSVDNKT